MRTQTLLLVVLLSLIPITVVADGGDDQPTDDTAWEWRQRVDEFTAPVFGALIDARNSLAGVQNQVCGMTDEDFVAADDPLAVIGVSENPTVRQTAWMLGQSLGRPIGYLRALQRSNNIRLSFVTLLIWFLLAGISWIVFIIVTTLLINTVRFTIEVVVYLYKLIPFV